MLKEQPIIVNKEGRPVDPDSLLRFRDHPIMAEWARSEGYDLSEHAQVIELLKVIIDSDQDETIRKTAVPEFIDPEWRLARITTTK